MRPALRIALPFILLIALLVLGCFSPALDLLSRPLRVTDDLRPADVVVAVSAGMLTDCKAHPNLFLRERHAAQLAQLGYSRSGMLIISGAYTDPAQVSMRACRKYLSRMLRIPENRLVIDNAARTTYENARHVARLMQKNGWDDAVLVTSRSHMVRALKTFRKQGVTVYPVQVPDLPPVRNRWFDHSRLNHIKRFLYEYGALIKYKWYGYI